LEEEEGFMKRTLQLGSIWNNLLTARKCEMLPSINHVVEKLDGISRETKVDALVTGSLHLVGAFLSLLDPELASGQTNNGHSLLS